MRISDWSSDVCSSDLESGRREFIEPGECEPERETDRGGDQEPARDPFRCIDRRPELRDALRQRPHRAAYRTPARSPLRRLSSARKPPAAPSTDDDWSCPAPIRAPHPPPIPPRQPGPPRRRGHNDFPPSRYPDHPTG